LVRKRFATRPFFSLSIRVLVQTAHFPSGEISQSEADSTRRISSAIQEALADPGFAAFNAS
jgi:hypothetical protein